jgi:hypothetical protein
MAWGSEMTVGKDTRVFQINRTNKTPIDTDLNNLERFQILAELRHDFHSLNDVSHQSDY